jgi:hypothetical protein
LCIYFIHFLIFQPTRHPRIIKFCLRAWTIDTLTQACDYAIQPRSRIHKIRRTGSYSNHGRCWPSSAVHEQDIIALSMVPLPSLGRKMRILRTTAGYSAVWRFVRNVTYYIFDQTFTIISEVCCVMNVYND